MTSVSRGEDITRDHTGRMLRKTVAYVIARVQFAAAVKRPDTLPLGVADGAVLGETAMVRIGLILANG